MDLAQQIFADADSPPSGGEIEWRSRYDGLVSIAHLRDKAVAGISGPWSGQFALTWWGRPLPARQLELYDSLEDAKREVESWAERMGNGNFPISAARADLRIVPPRQHARAHSSLLARVRRLWPSFSRAQPRRETIERLRRQQACSEADISDLHFAAIE